VIRKDFDDLPVIRAAKRRHINHLTAKNLLFDISILWQTIGP
jgi:hypothetical protein